MKKYVALIVVACLLGVGGFVYWISGQYAVPIMMYHNVRVTDEPKANSVSPANFDKQMAFLKKSHYNVMSFEEFVRRTVSGEPFPRKSAVITFDDGYEDNYLNAYPILSKYQFPAIIFIPSHKIGQPDYLTWAQVREMSAHNITIGSHTQYHDYLPDLPREQQMQEIFGSKRFIQEQIRKPVEYFAYPIGGFSDEIKQMVKEAGYLAAATTNRGYDHVNKDVYELNRIRFSDKDDRIDFLWMKLSGYYNVFREPKKPH